MSYRLKAILDKSPIYIAPFCAYIMGMIERKSKKRSTPAMLAKVLILNMIAAAAGLYSQPSEMLYFPELYYSRFETSEAAEEAVHKNPKDKAVLVEAANYYFITANAGQAGQKEAAEYNSRAFEIYQGLWKENFADPRIRTLMATAYTAQGANPALNIQTVVEYVFRARNLYSMVISEHPTNLDALLGRIRINMNLTAATGRPDEIHSLDIKTFIEGYSRLPATLKENPYFKNGLMEVYLAGALLAAEKKRGEEAAKYFELIDPNLLHEHAKKMYEKLKPQVEKIEEAYNETP